MELFRKTPKIDFMSKRYIAFAAFGRYIRRLDRLVLRARF